MRISRDLPSCASGLFCPARGDQLTPRHDPCPAPQGAPDSADAEAKKRKADELLGGEEEAEARLWFWRRLSESRLERGTETSHPPTHLQQEDEEEAWEEDDYTQGQHYDDDEEYDDDGGGGDDEATY